MQVFRPHDLEYEFIDRALNAHSRRARRLDMIAFVETVSEVKTRGRPQQLLPTSSLLRLPQTEAAALMHEYQNKLIAKNLAPATINRRLSTLRAWVRFGQEMGLTRLTSDALVGELATAHQGRFKGIDRVSIARLCAQPDKTTPLGVRDCAMLHLLCEVPLLGWQFCALRLSDFRDGKNQLQIPTVNQGAFESEQTKLSPRYEINSGRVPVNLSASTSKLLQSYLSQNDLRDRNLPLFVNFDRRPQNRGKGLVPKSILHLVKTYGKQASLPNLNTRTLRSNAIITALVEADWKISPAFQRFPHVGFHTWVHYCATRSEES